MAKTVSVTDAAAPPAAAQVCAMPPTFALPAQLTLHTVAALYPQCRVWMHAELRSELCVQAQDVTEADAAGVQLLLSWATTLAADQRRLRLVGPSDVLVAACTALGADGLVLDRGCP
jgi:ABC-type transporter Mla MlaB component